MQPRGRRAQASTDATRAHHGEALGRLNNPREFNAETALATARLIIRTAAGGASPLKMSRDAIAGIVQMVGTDLLDPNCKDAFEGAGDAGERESGRLQEAAERAGALAGEEALAAGASVVSIPGVYPTQTGSNLVMVGLAFPLAWNAEGRTTERVGEMEAVLEGHLEDECLAAARAILDEDPVAFPR